MNTRDDVVQVIESQSLSQYYVERIVSITYSARAQFCARGSHILDDREMGKEFLRRPTVMISVVGYPDPSHSDG